MSRDTNPKPSPKPSRRPGPKRQTHTAAGARAQIHGPLAAVLDPHGVRDPAAISAEMRSLPGTANADLVARRLLVTAGTDNEALRRDHLSTVARVCASVPHDTLAAIHARRRRATLELRGSGAVLAVTITPHWRVVVGHGEDSVQETSLTLSLTYGLPILPGSALKGVTAAHLRATSSSESRLPVLFGSPRPGSDNPDAAQGSVTFFDAIPLTPPTMAVDTLTPHVKPYYDEGNKSGAPTAQPGEYHNPVPIRFLAVAATRFEALIIGPEPDATQAAGLLCEALDESGIGGKTAAGYGYCHAESHPLSGQEPRP